MNPLHHFKTTANANIIIIDVFRISDNLYLLVINDGDQCDEYPHQDLGEVTKIFKQKVDHYLSLK